jgi:hypothetical protein
MDSVKERSFAYNMIKADGIPMIVYRNTQRTFTPSTGELTNIEVTQYPTYGIMTNYELKDIDGTKVLFGDRRVVIAATATMPDVNTGDTLEINSVMWTIIRSEPVSPNDVPICFFLQVRK